MQMDFFVDTQIIGRATLTLSGDLDLLSRPALEGALDRLLGSDAELLIVDLREVEFMDSTGLHLVVQAHQRAHAAGRRLVLVRGSEHVQRLFDLTGVTDSLTIVGSPEEVLVVDQGPGPS
jgi:anti-anti-sigma factor